MGIYCTLPYIRMHHKENLMQFLFCQHKKGQHRHLLSAASSYSYIQYRNTFWFPWNSTSLGHFVIFGMETSPSEYDKGPGMRLSATLFGFKVKKLFYLDQKHQSSFNFLRSLKNVLTPCNTSNCFDIILNMWILYLVFLNQKLLKTI